MWNKHAHSSKSIRSTAEICDLNMSSLSIICYDGVYSRMYKFYRSQKKMVFLIIKFRIKTSENFLVTVFMRHIKIKKWS